MMELAQTAKAAARKLQSITSEEKTRLIRAMAAEIRSSRDAIAAANQKDIEENRHIGKAKLDRLKLKIEDIVARLERVAAQPEPVGKVYDERTGPSGIRVRRVRVPIGVIFMIYEARPNVTAEAAALCFKASNACILRGGSEAKHSNAAIGDALRRALGPWKDAVQMVTAGGHEAVEEMLKLHRTIDLVIARGGEGLIRWVAEKSRIPVLKHYRGNCHGYVDAAADLKMAEDIVFNAKVPRPATCNAMEHLLVHASVAKEFIPRIARRLADAGVELRGDEASRALYPMKAATEEDWYEEYLDLVIGVKVVQSLEEAISHINTYGSGHTDAIVTRDPSAADRFLREVDSASVMVNCSTRMADGGEYGLGAEIGISTDKLHARGPMGAEELTTLKWVVVGEGQLRS